MGRRPHAPKSPLALVLPFPGPAASKGMCSAAGQQPTPTEWCAPKVESPLFLLPPLYDYSSLHVWRVLWQLVGPEEFAHCSSPHHICLQWRGTEGNVRRHADSAVRWSSWGRGCASGQRAEIADPRPELSRNRIYSDAYIARSCCGGCQCSGRSQHSAGTVCFGEASAGAAWTWPHCARP